MKKSLCGIIVMLLLAVPVQAQASSEVEPSGGPGAEPVPYSHTPS
ncbi:hypothetical protein NSQ26_08835 [Bacillus sp. FSL W7-1360]